VKSKLGVVLLTSVRELIERQYAHDVAAISEVNVVAWVRSESCSLPAPFEGPSSQARMAISAAASSARTKAGALSGSVSMAMPLIHSCPRGAPGRPVFGARKECHASQY
jgi:hypothetical protein